MPVSKIFTMLDNLITDRVFLDLEASTGPVSERGAVPFASFLFD